MDLKTSDNKWLKQPYPYQYNSEFYEPDWRRLPGYKDVPENEWNSAKWQRKNIVRSTSDVKKVFGEFIDEEFLKAIEEDQKKFATMPLFVTPYIINTINEKNLRDDPIRRYMLPASFDREKDWPNHPMATRDSLHEHEMWVTEGLTHRYPTKVLAELLSTCPQYCGHCTRMDLVGHDVSNFEKRRFSMKQPERLDAMLDYLRKNKAVRDVVVSGGDIANLPLKVLEKFVMELIHIENIRDIRLASKALMGLPQHFLQKEVLDSLEKLAKEARKQDKHIAFHTHINHANSVTPLVAKLAKQLLEIGFRDVRNQGVLLRGVNDSSQRVLDLCFKLVDHGNIMPYYFYLCEMIPNAEHWRTSVEKAQSIQHDIMGYLPGFATPRIVCDVPYVGKRWVHQTHSYDKVKGISYWTKNYLTSLELKSNKYKKLYEFYDPIHSLSEEGKNYWKKQISSS